MPGVNADGMNRCFGFPKFATKKNEDLWYLGPDIECERLSYKIRPEDALATWDDGQYMFVLRERKDTRPIDDSLPEVDDSLPEADDSLPEADDLIDLASPYDLIDLASPDDLIDLASPDDLIGLASPDLLLEADHLVPEADDSLPGADDLLLPEADLASPDSLLEANDSLFEAEDSLFEDDNPPFEADDPSLPEADLASPKYERKCTYRIGDAAFCKVQVLTELDYDPEPQLMARVKELEPRIPIPETIFTWQDGQCLWYILRRIPGQPLRNAWRGLTDAQREKIAEEVAQHVHALAQHTVATMQSALGGPADNPFKECSIPDNESPFHLVHGDLNPNNIIVDNGRLTGIIDWETLRYEPRFWLATMSMVTDLYGFKPELYENAVKNNAWGLLLSMKLVGLGHSDQSEAFRGHVAGINEFRIEWEDLIAGQDKDMNEPTI